MAENRAAEDIEPIVIIEPVESWSNRGKKMNKVYIIDSEDLKGETLEDLSEQIIVALDKESGKTSCDNWMCSNNRYYADGLVCEKCLYL